MVPSAYHRLGVRWRETTCGAVGGARTHGRRVVLSGYSRRWRGQEGGDGRGGVSMQSATMCVDA